MDSLILLPTNLFSITNRSYFSFKRFLVKLFFFFLAVLGLHCWARSFCNCGEQGLLFVAVRGLLIVVASLVAEHGP